MPGDARIGMRCWAPGAVNVPFMYDSTSMPRYGAHASQRLQRRRLRLSLPATRPPCPKRRLCKRRVQQQEEVLAEGQAPEGSGGQKAEGRCSGGQHSSAHRSRVAVHTAEHWKSHRAPCCMQKHKEGVKGVSGVRTKKHQRKAAHAAKVTEKAQAALESAMQVDDASPATPAAAKKFKGGAKKLKKQARKVAAKPAATATAAPDGDAMQD